MRRVVPVLRANYSVPQAFCSTQPYRRVRRKCAISRRDNGYRRHTSWYSALLHLFAPGMGACVGSNIQYACFPTNIDLLTAVAGPRHGDDNAGRASRDRERQGRESLDALEAVIGHRLSDHRVRIRRDGSGPDHQGNRRGTRLDLVPADGRRAAPAGRHPLERRRVVPDGLVWLSTDEQLMAKQDTYEQNSPISFYFIDMGGEATGGEVPEGVLWDTTGSVVCSGEHLAVELRQNRGAVGP